MRNKYNYIVVLKGTIFVVNKCTNDFSKNLKYSMLFISILPGTLTNVEFKIGYRIESNYY